MSKLLRLFPILAFFTGCTIASKHSNPELTDETVLLLKQNYNSEVFNYFYETVFYTDGANQKLKNLNKWNAPIQLAILGNPTTEEIDYITFLVAQIKELKLPFKITIVNDASDANFKIYIATREKLKSIFNITESNNAICKVTSTHGAIRNAEIGIPNNPDTEYLERKEAIILEEFIQAFGINGDSYSYPNSVFFEGKNYQDQLTTLDKDILRLLYDEKLPVNYAREDFENDFSDVLHTINSTQKIKTYVEKHNVSRKTLATIKNSCFIDATFYKHPKEVRVFVDGDYATSDTLQLKKAIKTINTFSPNLNLKLSKHSYMQPDAGVFFYFKKDNTQEYTIQSSTTTEKGMTLFPKRIKNEIFINYKETNQTKEKREKAIVSLLYKSLGPINMKTSDSLYKEENNTLEFGNSYKTIIETIYSTAFIDGLTSTAMDSIINHN